MTLKDFVFFDEKSETSESDVFNVTNAEELVLQVGGSNIDITIMGLVDLNSTDYTLLSAIGLADYTIFDKITSKGIYNVPLNGIDKVKIVSANQPTNTLRVYGKAIN